MVKHTEFKVTFRFEKVEGNLLLKKCFVKDNPDENV